MMDQKDVNFLFNISILIFEHPWFKEKNRTRDECQGWVADQLREHGIDTHPIGMSWGSIVTPEFRKKIDAPDEEPEEY